MSSVELLRKLNETYMQVHVPYEQCYRASYMGDKSVDQEVVKAKAALDAFRCSKEHTHSVNEALLIETDATVRERLYGRKKFFELYQIPDELAELKDKVAALEKKVESQKSMRTYGYTDPYTHEFVEASDAKMGMMMRTHDDEHMRKALFEGIQRTAADDAEDLIELINMRNQYAQALGFKHFYDYKTHIEEKMPCEEVRKLFDDLYDHAKPAYEYVRSLELSQPVLRQPRNYSYMMSGDFIKQEDPYFQLEDMLLRWGRSFAALGVDFRGANLTLDLLERKGKNNNGFCHMPRPVIYEDGERIPGAVAFTCTALPGQVGDGVDAGDTLFHEGGHAAHFANMDMQDVIYNTEYPPQGAAWAETQSQFMDTIFSSIERKTRYAKDKDGNTYPRELFEAKVRKFQPLAPRGLMSVACIVNFERILYQTPSQQLTKEFVIEIAKAMSVKYFDYETPSLLPLMPVHIYAWENACSYHGYGIAELAVHQRRKYWYEKDGYIVDNPAVGPAMQEVRKRGSAKSLQELVEIATDKKLSSDAYIDTVTRSIDDTLALARKRIAKLEEVPAYVTPVELGAHISLVHGAQEICDNEKGFEAMCEEFSRFLQKID